MGEKFPIQFGDFRLLRKVAQGGMAEIFLAQDKNGDICALKRILPHLAHQESFIRMFIDEARIVSHLNHPNVAGVYSQGKHDGYYYIAMEYVEGHSILALQERAKAQKMALPRGLLAYVVSELLNGLGHAHSARDNKGRFLGIVHRDVTPQNVLVSYDGEVKLIDFGVAKAKARLTHTDAGFTKGKLSYMSPEQARGDDLDGRSDLFSVGIILYEITTGRRLFNKEGPGGILGAIVNEPIPPPTYKDRKYPRDLEAILMRALEKDSERRWQNAEDMSDALKRFARRERPAPGAARMKNLVYDLFGEPKYRSLIEEARSYVSATPSDGVLAESTPLKKAKIRNATTDGRGEDFAGMEPAETRMMGLPDAEDIQSPEMKSALVESRRAATNEGVPDVDIELDLEDLPIPEPKIPTRVRLAQILSRFIDEVSESYSAHRWRYRLGGIAFGLASLALLAYMGGVFGQLGQAVDGAVEGARDFKKSAGLTKSSVDAGLQRTILRVKSEPPGALITINKIGAGCVTPCDLSELSFGKRLTVTLSQTGFREVSESLTLQANEGLQQLELSLERMAGRLSVDSKPSGAVVFVDGDKQKGKTPMVLRDLPVIAPISLELKKAGYFTLKKSIQIKDKEHKEINLKLKRDPRTIKPGKIVVKTVPPNCVISIGSREVGRSPLTHSIKPGTHTVIANCVNFETDLRTVYVESRQTSRIRMEPIPNVFGYLSVTVTPRKGTKVTINGRKMKLPINFKKVVPGRHEIVVENSSLRRKRNMSVLVKANQRVTRSIDLLK